MSPDSSKYSHFYKSLIQNKDKNYEYSKYWSEEIEPLNYLFEPTQRLVEKWRQHMFWITGDLVYNYKNHHKNSKKFDQIKFRFLNMKERYPHHKFIFEPKNLGGYGFELDGGLVNIDTLKFNESIIALDNIELLKNKSREVTFLEIGSGFGGMTFALASTFPKAKFILVDLPEVLFLAAIYLDDLFPNRKIVIAGDEARWDEFDILLCSADKLELLRSSKIDVMINICSFQEMTSTQVNNYATFAHESNIPHIYSHNRNYGPYNSEISSVSEEIEDFFGKGKLIEVLPSDYTHLVWKTEPNSRGLSNRKIKNLIRTTAFRKKSKNNNIRIKDYDNYYRHIIFSRDER